MKSIWCAEPFFGLLCDTCNVVVTRSFPLLCDWFRSNLVPAPFSGTRFWTVSVEEATPVLSPPFLLGGVDARLKLLARAAPGGVKGEPIPCARPSLHHRVHFRSHTAGY